MSRSFIPSAVRLAERLLPASLRTRFEPVLKRIDGVLLGTDDSAVSGRMALSAFTIRIFSAIIAYASQVLLARWMGQFEYGVYVSVWVAVVIIGGLACFGLQTGNIRFIAAYREAGDDAKLRGIISGSVYWSLLVSSVLAAIGVLGVFAFQDQLENFYIMPIYLAAVTLPMLAFQEALDGIARAYSWANAALLPTYIVRPLLVLLAMLGFGFWGFETDAQTAMIATIIAVYLGGILQLVMIRRGLRDTLQPGEKRYDFRHWLVVTTSIFFIEGFYTLMTNIDILLVTAFMRPEEVAIYFAAAKTLALVHFVNFAVRAAAAHRFSAYMTANNRARFEAFIRETIHWTFWPSLFLSVFMLATGHWFLTLFGADFAEAGTPVIWILTIGIMARATVGAAESVLTMSGGQNACALAYALTLGFAIILNLILIPRFGIQGAAMATSAGLIFESLALYAAARRRLGVHIFILPVGKAVANPSAAG